MRGDLKIGILPVIVGGFHVSVGPSSVSAVDLRTEGPKVGVHRDRTLQGSEELDGLYFCCLSGFMGRTEWLQCKYHLGGGGGGASNVILK